MRRATVLTAVTIAVTALVLFVMGHPLICKCGYVKLWHGVPVSSENSQHITDWYTFSHIIHGFVFYGLFRWVGPRWSVAARLLAATLLESSWEIFENTEFVINRYRTVTISLDYFGDSVLNSVCDILAMIAGFLAAARFPVWVTVALLIGMELFVGYMIRDNLLLNIIMLIYPLDIIRTWQSG